MISNHTEKGCAFKPGCSCQERVKGDRCHSIPPPRLVSSPPIPRTLSRPFINRRNLGPLSRAPLRPRLPVHLNVQGPLYILSWVLEAGRHQVAESRGLAESIQDGLDCLGPWSTWVATAAVRALLLCCASKLCVSLPGACSLSLHLFVYSPARPPMTR